MLHFNSGEEGFLEVPTDEEQATSKKVKIRIYNLVIDVIEVLSGINKKY